MDINATINITDSKAVKSLWSSIKGLASESFEYASKVTTETLLPATVTGIKYAASHADDGVDFMLKHANTGAGVVWDYVEQKLKANPNIAKTLAPVTVFRAHAASTVDPSFLVVNAPDQQ